MSGRGYGYCAGYDAPGRGMGRCGGRRRARGYGWGRGPRGPAPWSYDQAAHWGPPAGPPVGPSAEQELEALRQQAEYFEQGLERIRSRIDELEGRGEEE